VITALKLGTVRQNQDAETRRLSRKTERRSWPKREEVWPKSAFCGQNVKNAGQKKKYHADAGAGYHQGYVPGILNWDKIGYEG
jgi:hypothetical protein